MKILNINYVTYYLFLYFLLLSFNVSAQNNTFKFYDVQTGLSIVPEDVKLYDSKSRELTSNFDKKKSVRGEAIEMELKKGNYKIAIAKSGYKAMNIDFSATDDSKVNRRIMLSPKNPPKEVTAKYLRSLHRPDRTIITGYIADDMGQPIADALLRSDDGAIARTDESGYFQLSLSYDKEEFYGVQLKAFNITKSGFKTERREQVVVIPNGDALYRIQLERGNGKKVKQMSDFIVENGEITGRFKDQVSMLEDLPEAAKKNGAVTSNECLPEFITVGYLNEASGLTYCCPALGIACTDVVTLTLEEYTKRVVDNEWLHGWSNLNNIDEAYKAAAIAIRTFGAFRVNHPIGNNYHVTDSPCDQVYASGTTSWSINAGDATAGITLKVNGQIVKAEYSSENNNLGGSHCVDGSVSGAGCGNGFCKDAVTGNCISDPLGTGKIQYGHGRNMSQFGSARWASGVALGDWCVGDEYSGDTHEFGTHTWQEIIDMYYPSHDLIYCNGNEPEEECPTDLEISDYQGIYANLQASNTVNCSAVVVAGDDVKCHAPTMVTLKPGFHAQAGSKFHAYLAGCETNQDDCEVLHNTNFDFDTGDWATFGGCTASYNSGLLNLDITNPGSNVWDIILRQTSVALEAGKTYNLSVRAKADANRSAIVKTIFPDPYTNYMEQNITLTPQMQTFTFPFTIGSNTVGAFTELLLGADGTNVQVDFISITEEDCNPPPPPTCELLTNTGFDNGFSDWTTWGGTHNVTNGVATYTGLYVGTNAWDIGLNQGDLTLEAGKTYTLTFKARGSQNRPIQVRVIKPSPYYSYYWQTVNLTTNMDTYEIVIDAEETLSGIRLDLLLAVDDANVYIDDVSLTTDCNNKLVTNDTPNIRLYPNPATHTINVEYELPKSTTANIAVFDALGKLVKNMSDVELLAGTQTLNMDISDLAAGMYFYTLQAEEWKATKKFVIAK